MTHSKVAAEKQKYSAYFSHFTPGKGKIGTSIIVLLLFGIVVFGIYSETFESPFTFDDITKIVENPVIRLSHFSFKEVVKAGFKSSKTRPIAFISFALNYYFNQNDPVGYHIVNILIHILSGWFLFLFIRTTLKVPSIRYRYDHPAWIAFLAALIWLVHPVQTQSVTYIVQRMNSMASMLFTLSFWFYVNGRLSQGSRKKWLWFIGSTLAWLVSLGCKQITVTLPFLVFLYEWYFFQDLSKDWFKRSLKWILGITVLCVLIALVYTGFKPWVKLAGLRDFALNEFTLTQRALTQLRVVIYYISLLFYPHPSRLNLDYDFPLSYSLMNPATTLLALIGIIGLITLGIFLAKKQRLMSFCIFWFLGNLVIESSVIPLAIIFEHRLYLPSMLVCLITVILLYRYIKPLWLPVGIACVLVALCSYWTFERNKVWRDEVTLWTDCISKSPNKARPYSNLGKAQTERKLYGEAFQNFLKTLRIDPEFADAHYNLGFLLDERGKTNEAIAHYLKAVELRPDFVKGYNNLGIALLKQDRTNEAIAYFRQAVRIAPNLAKAHDGLGLAFSKQGRIDEAEKHYYEALRIKPDYAEAHNNLGGLLLKHGRLDKALEHITAALTLNPDIAEAHNNMGVILIQKGNVKEATFHFREAVRINPDFTSADANLKRVLAIQKQLEEKITPSRGGFENKSQ